MRKLLVILLTLILASTAMAEFKTSVKGKMQTLTAKKVTKDESTSWSQIRLRPSLMWQNEFVKAVLKLEIDQAFGKSSTDSEHYADIGADQKGAVEIKNAYIITKAEKLKNLYLWGGIKGVKFPGILAHDVPQIGIGYNFGAGSIDFMYIKTAEEDRGINTDDSQIYALDFKYKTDNMTIRPGLFMYQVNKSSSVGVYKDSMGIIPGLNLNLKFGNIGIDLVAAYSTGKDKSGASDVEYSGMLADLLVTYKIQKGIKIGGFFTYLTGDDPTSSKNESYVDASIASGDIGVERMFILEDAGTFGYKSDATGADVTDKSQGYMLFGAMAKIKIDAFTILAQLGYGQYAKVASGAKKDLGFEADLYLGYDIAPGNTLFTEIAFLATGEAYGTNDTKQAAMYANLGMKFKLK